MPKNFSFPKELKEKRTKIFYEFDIEICKNWGTEIVAIEGSSDEEIIVTSKNR